ncbi:(2Fe-2S) ferredoxin [Edaphobacter acidisoli]|uniref:(2Fe-2S) ferredoxin n=1 Tax=Edaphobacter acidisoli TaxID=2040573 RepID=A0A916W688_9BACT|nr:DUF1284 domain-containing protein [Edaphobacter acidisoli]GGA70472.1 (2Fe-2S) ferredoxin [Edaphobacter acidisoli]
MTIRLRPHHLLCMLTFVGEGYNPAFVQNFESAISRIAAGNETIEIVEGPDDLCAPLLTTPDCHCNNASVADRDRHATDALGDLLHLPIQPKTQIKLDQQMLDTMRKAFAAGQIRKACVGCQWSPLCDDIVSNCFQRTRLLNKDTAAATNRIHLRT